MSRWHETLALMRTLIDLGPCERAEKYSEGLSRIDPPGTALVLSYVLREPLAFAELVSAAGGEARDIVCNLARLLGRS